MKQFLATFIFFTRLPLWKISSVDIDARYYKQVINYWSMAGWLTGGVMAGTLWLAAQILPISIAVIFAISSRLLLTGALHEDGFSDFLDGFGGGVNKERILSIMKDSYIGVYGVIGLVIYFLLLYQTLISIPLNILLIAIIIGDPFNKFTASLVTIFLPYARNAEASKTKVVYHKMSTKTFFIAAFFGLLPLLLVPNVKWLLLIIFPIVVFTILVNIMKRKINGYTGDCCGAIFILCELSFYIGIVVLYSVN